MTAPGAKMIAPGASRTFADVRFSAASRSRADIAVATNRPPGAASRRGCGECVWFPEGQKHQVKQLGGHVCSS